MSSAANEPMEYHVEGEGVDAMFKKGIDKQLGEAWRGLVVSGRSSVFDLVKAIKASFGLGSHAYVHACNVGGLHLSEKIITLTCGKDHTTQPHVQVPGVSYRKHDMIGAKELKRVKMGWLLDRPMASSSTRAPTDGSRSLASIQMCLPAHGMVDRRWYVDERRALPCGGYCNCISRPCTLCAGGHFTPRMITVYHCDCISL